MKFNKYDIVLERSRNNTYYAYLLTSFCDCDVDDRHELWDYIDLQTLKHYHRGFFSSYDNGYDTIFIRYSEATNGN